MRKIDERAIKAHADLRFRSEYDYALFEYYRSAKVIAFLDRVNISIAGGSIADTYHLNNVQLGYIFSSLLFGYALFQAPGGRLADRFGPRRILALGVIWWGIFTAATALIPAEIGNALIVFMIVRFLLGAG